MVYYGFLLYLSFTKPVREWRYHWLLLPFQIFAVLNILMVGDARIEAGSHWITDALAGYLSGGLLLFLLIFLYRRTTAKLARRRAPGGIIGAIFPGLGDLSSDRKERDKHYEWSDDVAERTHAGTCEEDGPSTLVE